MYETFDLVSHFKIFCQLCTGRYEFWLAVAIFALIEPILCSKWPVGIVLYLQVSVLAISTFLYIIQLIGVASREWDKIIMIEAMSSLQALQIPKDVMDFTLLKLFIFFTAEGEYILEFACLLIGWILIFWHPGLAALRCFRPFRLLWFYDVEIFRSKTEDMFNPLLGAEFVSRGFRVLKFAIKALSALGNEMFRLTNDTKGGLLLMMIFFYSAFVLGAALWVETKGANDACLTLGQCMFVLMRLTFYDGDGLDFAFSLTGSHIILFFITMIYMCLTSFGILNGLVGIFGTAFSHASDMAFQDEEEHQMNVAINASEQNDDGNGGEEGRGKEIIGNEENKDSATKNNEGDGGGGVEDEVQLYCTGDERYSPNQSVRSFATDETAAAAAKKPLDSRGGLSGSKYGSSSFMKSSTKPQNRTTLRDLVRRSVSPSLADRAEKGDVYDEQVPVTMSTKLRSTGGSSKMAAHFSSDVTSHASATGKTLDLKTKKALDMFGKYCENKPVSKVATTTGMVPIAGSMAKMYGTSNVTANNTNQLHQMSAQMSSMQMKVNGQDEAIDAMLDQVMYLSRQIEMLHGVKALDIKSRVMPDKKSDVSRQQRSPTNRLKNNVSGNSIHMSSFNSNNASDYNMTKQPLSVMLECVSGEDELVSSVVTD